MNLRWYIAALLFLSSVINYIDRQTLSIAAPVLTKELHISPIEYSNILQAFLIAYTVMYLGSGFLVDRWGTRISMAAFMGWWSLANMLHAFANSAFQLGAFRFLLGVGEPGNFMGALKVTSERFPPKERAFVNGLVNAGASVGAIVAAPMVVWLMVRFGWRSAFVITGALGFVWLAAWLMIFRGPEAVMEPAPVSPVSPPIRKIDLLRYRQTWGLMLPRLVSDPVWWFYLFWLPKYLVEQRHFTVVQMGMLAWLPYLSSDLGAMAGGMASGYLIKRGWPILKARSRAMLPCALVMPLSLVIAFTPSSLVALAVICVITFAHMAWKTNLMTVTNDIYPKAVVGSVSGIIAFGSGLGGTLFTNFTGQVVERFSYQWIFIVMGFLHPLAYVLFRWLVRDENLNFCSLHDSGDVTS